MDRNLGEVARVVAVAGNLKKAGGGDWAAEDFIRWGAPPPEADPDREATIEDVMGLMTGRKVN